MRHCPASLALGILVVLGPAGAAPIETLRGLDFGSLASREITIHLPPGGVHATTPVIIALDGQMMTAWRLDESLAALTGREAPLVVAIPAGEARLDEYGLVERLDYAGRGKLAAAFQQAVLKSVLPAVVKRYHLELAPARTGVMGASLGGLAAFDLAWRHPEIFGFVGVFSGALWWRGDDTGPAAKQQSRLVHRLVRETVSPPRLRLWFEAGTKDETDDRDGNGVIDAIQDTTELLTELERRGYRRGTDFTYVEINGGRHNEATWAGALPAFLEWGLPANH
ncbi:MAG TPA: alpha/beta hydrolase-fold protein [Lacunisphaera sp.]|jgi:enterochelin esterase-like enzyme|nr:alpha/beta hydrolase-fold protein [Lacunisphaera sp.]